MPHRCACARSHSNSPCASTLHDGLGDMTVSLTLDEDQALVLLDWLARLDSADAFPVEDRAEELVLWALHGQLEKANMPNFSPHYRELVAAARAKVRAAGGEA